MTPETKRRLRQVSNLLSFVVLVGILAVFLFWDLMVHTTPVGHASVVWHRLSLDPSRTSEGPLEEGVHVILPWDKFYTYDTRLQTYDQTYEVVSGDGLHIELTMTFRWRAVKRNVVELNTNVGPNYLQTLLVPVVGSVAREVVARHDAEKLYSTERAAVQEEIYSRVVSHDYPNGLGERQTAQTTEDLIILEDTLIKSIRLPEALQVAIEQKLEQSQLVQGYEFRVQREELESQRKEIEAQGIRSFQETVSSSISESYLRWRGIEATLQLSQSPNAKVVVIGNSETGLPLILDTGSQDLTMPAPGGVAPGPPPPEPAWPRVVETGDGEYVLEPETRNMSSGHLETGELPDALVTVPAEQAGDAGASPLHTGGR